MEICPKEKCTACYACVNACPFHCITMREDEAGVLYPQVDEVQCKHCNVCLKTCPNHNEFAFKLPLKCYAAWVGDKNKRRICASGGIGTAMSEFAVKNRQGVVFGSRYDESLTPVIACTERLEELERFKGSRYVQSVVGVNTLVEAKRYLKSGRFVVYIGTPCQIAGLKTYLHHDYDNLVTVDLICHGVSPVRYFKEEIEEISRQKGLKRLSDARFRGNDGNNFCLTFWSDKRSDNSCRVYKRTAYSQYYFSGFLKGITLRENCYTCDYARPERISDITIGDFIGLGKDEPFEDNPYNVSVVLPNTEKGLAFYKEVQQAIPYLHTVDRRYEEALKYGPSLRKPFPRHVLQKPFVAYCKEMGYVKAIRKVLWKDVLKNRASYLPKLLFVRIPRKLKKVVLGK